MQALPCLQQRIFYVSHVAPRWGYYPPKLILGYTWHSLGLLILLVFSCFESWHIVFTLWTGLCSISFINDSFWPQWSRRTDMPLLELSLRFIAFFHFAAYSSLQEFTGLFVFCKNGGFHTWGYPQNGFQWKIRLKRMILGVPAFMETSKLIFRHQQPWVLASTELWAFSSVEPGAPGEASICSRNMGGLHIHNMCK